MLAGRDQFFAFAFERSKARQIVGVCRHRREHHLRHVGETTGYANLLSLPGQLSGAIGGQKTIANQVPLRAAVLLKNAEQAVVVGHEQPLVGNERSGAAGTH